MRGCVCTTGRKRPATGTTAIERTIKPALEAVPIAKIGTHVLEVLRTAPPLPYALRWHADRRGPPDQCTARVPEEQAFVFSYEPDHSRPRNPDRVSHRYVRMCAGRGIDSHLHALRHSPAT